MVCPVLKEQGKPLSYFWEKARHAYIPDSLLLDSNHLLHHLTNTQTEIRKKENNNTNTTPAARLHRSRHHGCRSCSSCCSLLSLLSLLRLLSLLSLAHLIRARSRTAPGVVNLEAGVIRTKNMDQNNCRVSKRTIINESSHLIICVFKWTPLSPTQKTKLSDMGV